MTGLIIKRLLFEMIECVSYTPFVAVSGRRTANAVGLGLAVGGASVAGRAVGRVAARSRRTTDASRPPPPTATSDTAAPVRCFTALCSCDMIRDMSIYELLMFLYSQFHFQSVGR